MTRPSLPLRLLLLCLATACAALPLSARAQAPSDPNFPLGANSPCFDTANVAESLALGDPPVFHDLAECPKLCKKAGLACAKHAKAAGVCETRWADDRARISIRVTCAGLRGADLKACAAPFEATRDERRQTAKDRQTTEVTACEDRGAQCLGGCDAP